MKLRTLLDENVFNLFNQELNQQLVSLNSLYLYLLFH